MTLQSKIYYRKKDCRKAESCRSLAGMRANEERQPLHMCMGSWYGLHQYEASEPKIITWEHAGNKGAFACIWECYICHIDVNGS